MRNVIMLSTLMLMFIIAGCSKDQKAVKTLDGVWQLTKLNGNSVDANLVYKLTFTECKLKKDEYCTIKEDYSFGGQSSTGVGEFLVMDKGETLELKFTVSGSTFIDRYKIKELEKSKLILEITEDNSVQTEEYIKL
jgi:hypothetical protein